VTARRILQAPELVEIRRARPANRMCAARSVFRRDMRALDVKRLHRAAVLKRLTSGCEVAQSADHLLRRSRNDGGEKAGNAG
jgi:hypothetical protein